ncbi:MAG: hypothetical protein H7328_06580 [Bdellovibrio sp.]|nr:hypothetical protein [Bdellovibrio sp.]
MFSNKDGMGINRIFKLGKFHVDWASNKFVILLFITISAISSTGWTANQCRQLFERRVDKVQITEEIYEKEVKDLRATLSGKLATVWRSEWKTKLEVTKSNQYVLNLAEKFLTPETSATVLKDLDINSPSFTRIVHARIYELQQKKMLSAADELGVRDSPPPAGARDTTFTYYTKPISNAQGDGKHQVRIRTYLREIKYSAIPVGESVQGFNVYGKLVTLTRVSADALKMVTGTDKITESEQVFTFEQMTLQHGQTMRLFAPHGRSFKLEIKSALDDVIAGKNLPLLAGKHMVQKLDVSLSIPQVAILFAPLKNLTPKGKLSESTRRIENLKAELLTKTPENKARIEAVLEVLSEAVSKNPEFLVIEGATAYHRTAFETTTGLQTTIDRDQGIYLGDMYGNNFLKNPIYTIQTNRLIITKAKDARHVELKVPVTSMENSVGIIFADPAAAPPPQNAQYDARIKEMLKVYHQFVNTADHPGKFNYIRENGVDVD